MIKGRLRDVFVTLILNEFEYSLSQHSTALTISACSSVEFCPAPVCSMTKRKQYVRQAQDFVSEELVVALLEKPSYDFSEIFTAVYEKLRARNAAGGGKEMLRLRV